jgi:hypothetical protein
MQSLNLSLTTAKSESNLVISLQDLTWHPCFSCIRHISGIGFDVDCKHKREAIDASPAKYLAIVVDKMSASCICNIAPSYCTIQQALQEHLAFSVS